MKLKEELKKQMAIEKHDTDKGISYKERELNKGVLRKITEDPKLGELIQRQLKISTVSSRA
jgi:hypothetical protein